MDAIEEFVNRCRRKLVDTSMRNRLLNFPPGGRSGAVEIVREHPAALWETIVGARRSMVFRGRAEDDPNNEGDQPSLLYAAAESEGTASEDRDAFADSIIEATAEGHRDNFLETRVAASALPTKLLRLSETARLIFEEQGVGTLFLALGCLRFFEAENSDIERRAPLILVPVLLEREGKDRWRIRIRDDDPIVNPALVEYLSEQHGIALPELPEALETFSPSSWYEEVQHLVSGKPRWRVSADCIVGIFSFQKFVMHEDLKRNIQSFLRHDVVGQLATRSGIGGGKPQLPPDVSSLDLDRDCPIETMPLVIDADSSQLRALAAISRGHHMVIEGPPGTGKSQTIANLIAGALYAGKTVLFVAEKQAALNVVYDRLKKYGLSDFCFAVHSKASKTVVLKDLGRALDASLVRSPTSQFNSERLTQVREELTQYTRAVHAIMPPLCKSAYGVIGRLGVLADAPETRVAVKTEDVSGEVFAKVMELLAQLCASSVRVGPPDEHPWRDASKDYVDIDAREKLETSLPLLRDLVPRVEEVLTKTAAEFGTPPDPSPAEADVFSQLADVLDRCPGVENALVADQSWSTSGQREAAEVIQRGRSACAAERLAADVFRVGTKLAELESAMTLIERYADNSFAWIRPSWRRARSTLRQAVRENTWGGAAAAARAVRKAMEAVAKRQQLQHEQIGAARFGARWRGGQSDWNDLERTAAWILEFRSVVSRHKIANSIFDLVAAPSPPTEGLRRTSVLCEELVKLWKTVGQAVGWPQTYWEDRPLRTTFQRIRALCASPLSYRQWMDFHALREQALKTIAAPFVLEAQRQKVQWTDLSRAFERRFYERWLDTRMEATPVLRRFLGDSHAAKISEFRKLDRQILDHHRRTLAAQLRARAQARLQHSSLQDEVRFLRDQLARQRGHKPMRQLLKGACGAIQALKPCFLMSPMTVAQGLNPEKHLFDLVIFDEASQLTPEDALGAVVRGKQVVVVGDPKQLPPTNFFAVQSGQVEAKVIDDEPQFDDLDSVLELALASGFAGTSLRWHYRSRHESLIAFSNYSFYDSQLCTFPGADLDRRVRGLRFEFVPNGCYEGRGVNRAEARRVVEEVIDHARRHPTLSLGVGTFSLPQQIAVQDELEQRRREKPWLDEFLSLDRPEPFFVKNLESIQGDERDVVILSITYGRGPDGKVRNNFGPINGQNGWRRLNVLASRARERMLVLSSMRADDIDVTKAQSSGARFLRAFLRYAESDILEGNPVVDATSGTESLFEAEVAAALARAGVRVQPQIGVAGYRIDLGILDDQVEGRFVCGIECDGVAYHSAESARDRDRLREEVLRGLGWTLHRVWSLDWWHDRKGQTERLVRLIDQSKEEARRTAMAKVPGANEEQAPPPPASPPTSDRTPPENNLQPSASAPLQFAAYTLAKPHARGTPIIEASSVSLANVMLEILRDEGPIHEEDLRARTMVAFGQTRAGSRIVRALDAGLRALGALREVETDGHSWRVSTAAATPRCRAGTGISPDRIPSWEFEAAVTAVLKERGALAEGDVVATVRDAFGYGSASSALREGVLDSLERMIKAGKVGIGGTGLRLVSEGATPS